MIVICILHSASGISDGSALSVTELGLIALFQHSLVPSLAG